MRPLLATDHPAFPLVRRHADWLRDWLSRETGWAVAVEADFARIEEASGLVAEIRAEGLAMVDASGDLADEPMPAEGTEAHVTLLLADLLAREASELGPQIEVAWEALHEKVREWAGTYRGYWKKSARDPGAEAGLCRQAALHLQALRLAEIGPNGLRPLPAIGRYALAGPTAADTAERD